jgi:L-fuconolactonase
MTAAAGIVDAHQHVWDLSAHEQPWLQLPGNEPLLRTFAEADLAPHAREAGVSATVVVQTVTEPGETPELLALAASSSLVAGVVGWVDLQADNVAEALAALRHRADGSWLRGIRHPVLIEDDPLWLVRPAVLGGLTAVGAAGLCYDLVLAPEVLPAAVRAAAACPGVTFVLDHLGNPRLDGGHGARPDQRWVQDIRQFAALGNTVCKLSGILAEPPPAGLNGRQRVAHLVPWYETVLEAFGPERLMFGSDWPVCTLSAPYADVVAAAHELIIDLSPREQDLILGGTARRVYQIG